MSRFNGPSEFRENPLAHFEKEPQLSVSYDEWVSKFDKPIDSHVLLGAPQMMDDILDLDVQVTTQMYHRPLADLVTRLYYKVSCSCSHKHRKLHFIRLIPETTEN